MHAILCCLSVAFSPWAVAQAVWIAGWQNQSTLLSPRAGAASVEAKGVIYTVGGIDGTRFLGSTEYARIMPDGALAPWRATTPLQERRGFFSAVAHQKYIYAVGGGNGANGSNLLRSVERAEILPDGSLGAWAKEKNALVYPRRCTRLAVVGNYIYAIGGYSGALLDSVERAEILPDGRLGKWTLQPQPLTMPRYVHAVAQHNDAIFVIGGHAQKQGDAQSEVEWTQLANDKKDRSWRRAASLQTGRYGLSAAAHGNYVYALGGINNLVFQNTIEKLEITAEGVVSAWQGTTPLPLPLADFSVVSYKDWLYILGGTNAGGYYNTVMSARTNETGDIGFWGEPQHAASVRSAPRPAAVVKLPNVAVIAEVIDTALYTYLRVITAQGDEEWLAAAKGGFTPDSRIRYSDGVRMTDFYSKILQRRFASIRFVGNVIAQPVTANSQNSP